MTRKNRFECWVLRAKNGGLVGREDMKWFEAYKTLTFRTRKAALLYLGSFTPPMPSKPVKVRIETHMED